MRRVLFTKPLQLKQLQETYFIEHNCLRYLTIYIQKPTVRSLRVGYTIPNADIYARWHALARSLTIVHAAGSIAQYHIYCARLRLG